MTNLYEPPMTREHLRQLFEWLLLQIEHIEDEQASYESRTGRPWDQSSREMLDRLRESPDPRVQALFDMAGAEWAGEVVLGMKIAVKRFVDGHGLDGPEETPDPARVVEFDPERAGSPRERERGAGAPGKGTA